jgi:holliday junction DNA helicase RuvA
MIYHVNGKLVHKANDYVVIEANGIGYQIFIPELLQNQLPNIGEELKLYTYHHIREDAQTLFGFDELESLSLFVTLTSVSGVGPKMGMKILSAIIPPHLIQAIIKADIHTLTAIPGLGKKMAERIIVELKDKLPKIFQTDYRMMEKNSPNEMRALEQDLLLALKTLGYSTDEARKALTKAREVLEPEMTLETALKILLRYL